MRRRGSPEERYQRMLRSHLEKQAEEREERKSEIQSFRKKRKHQASENEKRHLRKYNKSEADKARYRRYQQSPHGKAMILRALKLRKARLEKIKAKRRCLICGERDPRVLQFRPRDPQRVKFRPIMMNATRSFEDWYEVIKACDVLCLNCIRKTGWKARLGRPGSYMRNR